MKGNAKECKGNIRGCKLPGERTGMQGNAMGMNCSGCKVPEECRECTGMQGNARETYGSECKVPGEYT